ncbi:tetratricopeptide repeat protein [Algibacter pacificus]|uniref:tetratricopeptide repeat protein n=1 Tax=Algibacter pacificus TaxID=2599389 RepID=UPI0011C9B149|nr:cell surface protein [Algibacter pacificus]
MKITKIINPLVFVLLASLFVSCNNQDIKITAPKDYNAFLEVGDNKNLELALEDLKFWKEKLEKTPNQFPFLVKVSASQSQIFEVTGKIESLKEAEENLLKANRAVNYMNSGYLRALARNYISQHKFKEALELLKKAEDIGEHLKSTQKMLFDVHLEIGGFDTAKAYLDTFKDFSDFDYLIRLSKWSDHRGDLDAAIKYMERAKTMAESTNIPATKKWVYTNLADYYGHAGNIEDSYNLYLKALEIDPQDAYSKKGIAWIVYSYEKNPEEALRILDYAVKAHQSPDYYLLQAEIAEYLKDDKMKHEQLALYKKAVSNTLYGDMYNKYNVLLFAEDDENKAKALEIALTEITNRPTPQSYDLLAWSYFNLGKYKKAMSIMEEHVVGKTSEPDVLYHLAEIYKVNKKLKKCEKVRKELDSSIFELGPIMALKINNI